MPSSAKDRKPRKLADDRPLFERQPQETDKSWEAFVTYRDLGVERSFRAVSKKLNKGYSVIKTWAARWSWKKRIAAWEVHIDQQVREEQIAAVKEMRGRHIQIAKTMQGLGMNELGKHIKESRENKTTTLTATQAATLAEQGLRIERLNLGEPESVNEEINRVDMTWTDMVELAHRRLDTRDEEEEP